METKKTPLNVKVWSENIVHVAMSIDILNMADCPCCLMSWATSKSKQSPMDGGILGLSYLWAAMVQPGIFFILFDRKQFIMITSEWLLANRLTFPYCNSICPFNGILFFCPKISLMCCVKKYLTPCPWKVFWFEHLLPPPPPPTHPARDANFPAFGGRLMLFCLVSRSPTLVHKISHILHRLLTS